ncbi:MAG: hypothetical protein ACTS43_00625 [Candidatus Hodgkinia cicadicola]
MTRNRNWKQPQLRVRYLNFSVFNVRTDFNETDERPIQRSLLLLRRSNDSSTFQQMSEPMFRGKSIISQCNRKCIGLRPNIGSISLNIKANLLRRSANESCKENLSVKLSKFAAAANVRKSFVNNFKNNSLQIETFTFNSTSSHEENVTFRSLEMCSQSC